MKQNLSKIEKSMLYSIALILIFLTYEQCNNPSIIVSRKYPELHGEYGCGNDLSRSIDLENKKFSKNSFYSNMVFDGNELHSKVGKFNEIVGKDSFRYFNGYFKENE